MNTAARFGIALEASTLLAADSFHRWLRLSKEATAAKGAILAVDPAARDQFVRTVDLFLDRPPYYLIDSRAKLPQPSAVGTLVSAAAEQVAEAAAKTVLAPTVRSALHRQFLHLFARSPQFQTAAIRWAAFQLLSTDLLQGHVIRMDVPYGRPLVDTAARSAFAQALQSVEGTTPQAIVEKADSTARNLGFQALLKASGQIFDALGLRHLTFGSVYLQGLLYEALGYRDLAKTLRLAPETDITLFLLAYADHACIRAWQNVDRLSRQPEAQGQVYLAHHVRSTFLFHSRQEFGFAPAAPGRRFWWSWGGLLAQAVAQYPAQWPAQAVQRTLQALRSSLDQNGVSVSVDAGNLTSSIEPAEDQLRLLLSLAREHKIVLSSDESKDGLSAWAPALGQLLPFDSADHILHLLSLLMDAPLPDGFADALRSRTPAALHAFQGPDPTSPVGMALSGQADWLEGSRAGLSALYSTWDGDLNSRTARVALSGTWETLPV